MPDRDRDLKLLCEQVAEDFLKNQEAENQQTAGDALEKMILPMKD